MHSQNIDHEETVHATNGNVPPSTTPDDRVKLFIGTSSNGEDRDTEAVYEYTLRKNSSLPIDIVWMRQNGDRNSFWSGFDTSQWPTPFSGFRWAIPEYCLFKGRAIYTDVDMINFKDIASLWNTDLEGKPMAARKGSRFGGHEFCVTVFDCAEYKKTIGPMFVNRQRDMAEFHRRCIGMFSGRDEFVTELDPRWNCLDGEGREIEDIWQLHWTSMPTQPWKPKWFTGQPSKHPRKDLVDLFWSTLDMARMAGYRGQSPVVPPVKYDIIGR